MQVLLHAKVHVMIHEPSTWSHDKVSGLYVTWTILHFAIMCEGYTGGDFLILTVLFKKKNTHPPPMLSSVDEQK